MDGNTLVDRITARAKNWTSRALSYAGRVQLVKSILFAIQVFWSSLFILPKGVIKQVDQILRAFLFQGSDLSFGGAKVARSFLVACFGLIPCLVSSICSFFMKDLSSRKALGYR